VFFIVVLMSFCDVCFNAKSLKYQLKSSSLSNFLMFLATLLMHLLAESRPKFVLTAFLTWKLWEWKIILTKTANTNNNLSVKSCPHELKSSSLSNFFLFCVSSLMHLWAESRLKSYLNGFIDMKTMWMKDYFNQNS